MNKRTLLIAAVVGLLVLGGAAFALYSMRMNAPAFRGRAIPVGGIKEEFVAEWQTAFESALQKEEVLQAIVSGSNYAETIGVPSGDAVGHLKEAIRVRFKNRNDSIEVGLVGKRKDDAELAEIATIVYAEAEREVLENSPSFQAYREKVEQNKSE